jgi:hypothetical protein
VLPLPLFPLLLPLLLLPDVLAPLLSPLPPAPAPLSAGAPLQPNTDATRAPMPTHFMPLMFMAVLLSRAEGRWRSLGPTPPAMDAAAPGRSGHYSG